VQHVVVLALVFMDTLDLDIEQRGGISDDTGALADAIRRRGCTLFALCWDVAN
jgi:hypothetical protein